MSSASPPRREVVEVIGEELKAYSVETAGFWPLPRRAPDAISGGDPTQNAETTRADLQPASATRHAIWLC